MGRWGNVAMSKMQNGPAQRHSIMSNLKIETENSLPQRYSKMSNGRLAVLLCWPHGQRAMSTIQVKNIARCFGRLSGLLCWPHGAEGNSKVLKCGSSKVVKQKRHMGRKHKRESSSAQRDSSGFFYAAILQSVKKSIRLSGLFLNNNWRLASWVR